MQKVLIVDDEQLARGYIRDLIDWFQFDMEVLGEAGDGEVALQYFDTYEPDIVITDIKMPFMTGIELLRKVKKRNPKTQVIIISSYDDFCYAQEAIKYGAAAYVFKCGLFQRLVQAGNGVYFSGLSDPRADGKGQRDALDQCILYLQHF